jgi:hypothetical protein
VAQAFVLRTVGTVTASNSVTAVPGGIQHERGRTRHRFDRR